MRRKREDLRGNERSHLILPNPQSLYLAVIIGRVSSYFDSLVNLFRSLSRHQASRLRLLTVHTRESTLLVNNDLTELHSQYLGIT